MANKDNSNIEELLKRLEEYEKEKKARNNAIDIIRMGFFIMFLSFLLLLIL